MTEDDATLEARARELERQAEALMVQAREIYKVLGERGLDRAREELKEREAPKPAPA